MHLYYALFLLANGIVIKNPESNPGDGLQSGIKFFENLDSLKIKPPCWLESERATKPVLAGL